MAGNSVSSMEKPLSYEQRLWRWRVLIATYFGYGGYYLCRKVFTICKTTLSTELGVSMQDIAHIWTTYLIAYMLGQFIMSYLGRKRGPRVLLLGGFALSMVCNTIFGFTNSYWTFLTFMFFNGICQASGWPGAVGGVAHWLRPRERGGIMGIWSTSYVLGNIAVKQIGGYFLAAAGWRYAFFGMTAISFIIWWLMYFWQRTKPEDIGLNPIVDPDSKEQRSVKASTSDNVTFLDYLKLAFSPIVMTMGLSYFCLKFLRYALDSWLPTFLDMQGMDPGSAAQYSSIFDWTGLVGAIIAGYLLDRVFRGRWDILCILLGVGIVIGYITVLTFGGNPKALAVCFGLVGFMLYGPDTLLGGAAAVQVAGEKNAVAVAGLVNGIGSIGPILQEEVIGWLIEGRSAEAGIRNTNLLAFGMSIAFVMLMMIICMHIQKQRNKRARITVAT